MDSFPAAVTQQPSLITLKFFMEIYGLSQPPQWQPSSENKVLLRDHGWLITKVPENFSKSSSLQSNSGSARGSASIPILRPTNDGFWKGIFFLKICNLKVSAIWVTDSLTFHHHGGDQPAAERSRGQLPLMDWLNQLFTGRGIGGWSTRDSLMGP